MKEGKDDQRPKAGGCAETNAARRAPLRAKGTPGRREAVRAARHWHNAQAEQAQPVRQVSGALSGTRRGRAAGRSVESGLARSAHDKEKQKRAEALDAYTSPFSAIDRTESPATIR